MQAVFRLKKKYQFRYIYKNGVSTASREMVMLVAKNNSGKLQVGFSVSKKIGKAVVRNKVKRRMREAFSALIPDVDKGYNYIFIAREPVANASFADINKSMLYMLKKQNLLIKR